MMIKNIFAVSFLLVSLFFLSAKFEDTGIAKDKTLKPDLTEIVKGKGWTVLNRKVSLVADGSKKGVRFDDGKGVGLAWLNDYKFKDGTIEFDVRGKNVLQKSFVGIAFQALDENNYDSIYFRPFNFKSEDADRHNHAVQYIAAPDYGWKKLREEQPGKYEQPVDPAPNPDGWFHTRILIIGKQISVFVGDSAKPSLVVEKLTESREGKIGLWVGDDSDGEFANLKISPASR